MVHMFMRDLKNVPALWSVCTGVSALKRFCYKGLLRNTCGTKFFVRLRELFTLGDVRFGEVPLYCEKASIFFVLAVFLIQTLP